MPPGEHPRNRKIGATNSVIRGCALLMAFTAGTEPALARSYLDCLTKKVVIVDAPRGSTSSSVEEHLGFWIDEAAKTLELADSTPLTVHRFDDHWISAAHGDTSYELDCQNGNLTYAGFDHKGRCGYNHNRVRPVRNCSRSGGISGLHAPQLAFPHDTLVRFVHAFYRLFKLAVSCTQDEVLCAMP